MQLQLLLLLLLLLLPPTTTCSLPTPMTYHYDGYNYLLPLPTSYLLLTTYLLPTNYLSLLQVSTTQVVGRLEGVVV